ncbi:uncharacterized protein LOC124497254 [Dermatophagoides farinae]|uniref:uncharacterized protein LOC124497254 n=1 Tax=Dermatophagoides farinae TaxID=6954 RepID=UPI003F5F196B
MDWMYKGVSGHVDREDYLTGRKIDKSFEMIDREENPHLHRNDDDEFCLPTTSTSTSMNDNLEQSIMNMSKTDIVAKMREDPLFQIKMKQMEKRKELLKNPLKLKKLKNLLQSSLAKEEKSKKRKKKRKANDKKKKQRSKKSRKHSKHSSTSSSSSSSSTSESESESSDSESDSNHRSKKSAHRHHHDNRDQRKHQSDRKYHSNQRQSESTRRHSNNDSHDRYRSSKSNHQSLPSLSKNKSKLTEEEIERKRREMMSNAEWREQTRSEKVTKLNQRDHLEDHLARESFRRQHDNNNDSDDDHGNHSGRNNSGFIRSMLSKMADKNTVERSIQQKRFHSQRDHTAMDRNFARKT